MRLPQMDPAKLTLVRQPFDHPDFLFELKHDGFRALAYISDGHCELVSRRRNSYKSFGELRAHLAGLKVRSLFKKPPGFQKALPPIRAQAIRPSSFLCSPRCNFLPLILPFPPQRHVSGQAHQCHAEVANQDM